MFWACGSRKEGETCPTFKALLLTKLNFNSDGFFVIEGEKITREVGEDCQSDGQEIMPLYIS
jgi:hypothetical protein